MTNPKTTADMKTPATPKNTVVLATFPRIGTYWNGEGGINAGIARGRDGVQDYFLIRGPISDKPMNLADGREWVKSLSIDGHSDFRMCVVRGEGRLLAANADEDFTKHDGYFWIDEQHPGYSDYAFIQDFGDGYQYDSLKSFECWVCAVRRAELS